jgi:hypothetical protein
MARAMLIMDMPSSCIVCPCSHYEQSKNFWVCYVSSATLKENEFYIEKPKCCPLREVPSKHEDGHTLKVAIENDCYDDTVQDDAWCEGVDKGYNACIDEILGGAE